MYEVKSFRLVLSFGEVDWKDATKCLKRYTVWERRKES